MSRQERATPAPVESQQSIDQASPAAVASIDFQVPVAEPNPEPADEEQEVTDALAATESRAAELDRIANIGAAFALKIDKQTGKVIEATPDPGTVKAWGLAKRWPQWLVDAMAVQRYPNQVLTEREAEDLALSTAGTPLGPQKVQA